MVGSGLWDALAAFLAFILRDRREARELVVIEAGKTRF